MSTDASRGGLFASPPPTVAVDIARDRVTALSLTQSGGQAVIAAYAFEALSPNVLDPALNAPNIRDSAALTAAVTSALDKVASRTRRVALVLPDTVGKVSLVRFDKVPGRAQDLDQLIRWQVRKAAPFRIEDAQVSWIPGLELPGGGREFVVTMARRDIVGEYEQACEAAGAQAGIIDLATFNLINVILASGTVSTSKDWLLVHVAADYATLAVVRGEHLVFFRNRGVAAEAELADLVHQTAMYHEDRLGGGGFSHVVLGGAAMYGADQAERVRRGLEERLGTRVEPLDFRGAAAVRDRITVNPGLLDMLAPGVGVLLRERGSTHAAGRVA